MPALHHLELWVSDLVRSGAEWEWLLGEIGWYDDGAAGDARSWTHPDGTRLVMASSDDVAGDLDRMHAGINHLAFPVPDRLLLDRIRSSSTEHGWHELFADRYPHAGGEEHTALYLENSEGFEAELVVA